MKNKSMKKIFYNLCVILMNFKASVLKDFQFINLQIILDLRFNLITKLLFLDNH